jgi:hypothetical protein
MPLSRVISEVPPLPGGGTLAVWLASHALARGYGARIYTYNLNLFDPTWFNGKVDIAKRLRAQARKKTDPRLRKATDAYLKFLKLGGELAFEELTPSLLAELIAADRPVLTGLSATYLYACARERDERYDDIGGEPSGHFVIVAGYDARRQEVLVVDPLHDNPAFRRSRYRVNVHRMIGAIMLGIITYDANLLVIEPRDNETEAEEDESL